MKTLTLVLGTLLSLNAFAADREVVIHTEKVGDAVHWMPAKIEVHPGEKIKLVAKHNLEGGFNFHGLDIKALNIKAQVDRNSDWTKDITIPTSLKPGEYKIGCQYHPAHVSSMLVVSDPEKPAAAEPDAPGSTKPQKLDSKPKKK